MNPFFQYFNHYRLPISRYFWQQFPRRVKRYHAVNVQTLPAPDTSLSDTLTSTLFSRMSDRSFATEPLALTDLSTLLFHSMGQYDERPNDQFPEQTKAHRSYPSGGGKYPLECYLLIRNVPELESGLYHYLPDTHELECISTVNEREMSEYLSQFSYDYAHQVSVMLLFSFIKERSVPKYGYFAYKIGLIEMGHISQNVYLLAAALSLKCCAFGGMREALFHKALLIDGYNETIFYAIGLTGSTANHE